MTKEQDIFQIMEALCEKYFPNWEVIRVVRASDLVPEIIVRPRFLSPKK